MNNNVTFTTTVCNAKFIGWYDALERCVWLSVTAFGKPGPLLHCTDDEAAERRLCNPQQYELLHLPDGHQRAVHHRNAGRFGELLGHCVAERLEFVRLAGISFSLATILRRGSGASVPPQLQPACSFVFVLPPFRIDLNFVRDQLLLAHVEADGSLRWLSIAGFDRKADADDWAQACRSLHVYPQPRQQQLRSDLFFLTDTLDRSVRTVHDLPHACGLLPIALTFRQFAWFYACLMFFLWDADKLLPSEDTTHSYFPRH